MVEQDHHTTARYLPLKRIEGGEALAEVYEGAGCEVVNRVHPRSVARGLLGGEMGVGNHP